MVPITIYTTREQHRALRVEGAERGMTLTEIVLEAIRLRTIHRLATHEDDPK